MNSQEYVQKIKEKYPSGTRIRLISMGDPNEKYPVEPNSLGTVRHVDDQGTLIMSRDSGRSLGVIPEIDKFEVLI